MIGLGFLFIVFMYIYIGHIIINKIQSIKTKNIVLTIIILIPIWDVILGFPIYAYLCLFNSGSKIYKQVNNVEGYYLGEVHELGSHYMLSEENYKYKEFKLMSDGNYYRMYWLNKTTSPLCINPYNPNNHSNLYRSKFRNGECIAIEQIDKKNLSPWEVISGERSKNIPILGIRYGTSRIIRNRQSGEILGQRNYVYWCGGWVNRSIGFILNGSLCGGSASCGRALSKKDDIRLQVLQVKIKRHENNQENHIQTVRLPVLDMMK